MCNPITYSSSSAATSVQRTPWSRCKDLPNMWHFVGNNRGVTVARDHNIPQLYSATDGAGTFNIRARTPFQAMAMYMRFLSNNF